MVLLQSILRQLDDPPRVQSRLERKKTRHKIQGGCTVHIRKDGCEVWIGSQVMARAQAAAKTAGLPLDEAVPPAQPSPAHAAAVEDQCEATLDQLGPEPERLLGHP